MLLHNLQLQPIDVDALKQSLKNLDDVSEPTQEELEQELGDYYDTTLTVDAASRNYVVKYNNANLMATANLFSVNGNSIFTRIRQAVCAAINALSSVDEIIDAILNAIASIIPGGVIIEWIIKRLVKFFLNKGFAWLCPVPAP